MHIAVRKTALLVALALLAAACDGSNPVDPPTTGTLTLTVETVGGLPDPNGYQITRAGAAPLDVPVNGSVRLDSLAPGAYTFTLGKASLYCAADDGATRTAQVVAGQSAQVTFRVRCERNGVAYVRSGTGGVNSFHIAFPGREPVTLAPAVSTSRVRFSPDGRRIAYTAMPAAGGVYGVFVMDLDSMGITQVTPAGSPVRTHPAWSPDGARMAYSTPTEVRVLRIGETAETVLWRTPVNMAFPLMPTWSPDGTRIAFAVAPSTTTPTRILVMNADGSDVRELITLQTNPYLHIDWSPDGTSIAFHDRVPGGPGILYTVNVATGVRTQVLAAADRNFRNVSYLRDGRIGFFAETYPGAAAAGNWIVNPDGTGLTQAPLTGATGALIAAWQ